MKLSRMICAASLSAALIIGRVTWGFCVAWEKASVWAWPKAMPTADPGVQRVELSVGDATRALQPDQVRDIIATLIGR